MITYKNKTFYNTIFPPPSGYKSIMLFGFVFTHTSEEDWTEANERHERGIHVPQYIDCLILGGGIAIIILVTLLLCNIKSWWLCSLITIPLFLYYIWYCLDFFIQLIKLKTWKKAYKNIIFERQAYKEQGNTEFKYTRFSFLKY